jgi:hypothetical protein
MSYETNEVSIKVIGFSGKKKDWITWEEKFLSKAKRRGYKDLLLGKVLIPESTTVLTVIAGASDEDAIKAKVKTRELNEQGYSDLILSMDTKSNAGKVAFNLVRGSKTPDYEDGNIAVAFKSLKRKYSPKTAPTLAKYHKLFYSAKLKKKADPDVFITYLEDLRLNMAEMKSTMSDDQFLLHLLNNLTKEYEPEVKDLEKRIGSSTDPLDIEEVREDLSLRYERLGKTDDDSDSDDEEHALYVGGQFKGRCNKCGKYGHKAAECRSKPGDDNKFKGQKKTSGFTPGKFSGLCHYCKKEGHRASDCRKKKREQSDQANAAKGKGDDDDMAEVVLMAVDIDFDEEDDSSGTDEDMPALIPRDSVFYNDSSSEGTDVPELMNQFYFDPSSSDDEGDDDKDKDNSKSHPYFLPDLSLAFAALSDDDDSENQIGYCKECGGRGHVGMYCSECEDSGMIYEPESERDADSEEETKAENVASIPLPEAREPRAPMAMAIHPDEMECFLRRVSVLRGLSSTNVDSWIRAVKAKFITIGITDVLSVMTNIMKINRMLVACHYSPMHWHTLDAMAQVGADILSRGSMFVEGQEIAMANIERKSNKHRFSKNTWLGDSAASTHMGNCDEGMFEVQVISSPIKIGNGKVLTATKIGKKRLTVVQEDGTTTDIVLEDYKYVPELWINLFSIPKSLGKGWNIGNKGVRLYLTKGNVKITFDREFPTQKGLVLGVEMLPRTSGGADTATAALDRGQIVSINKLHKIFGHVGEESLRKKR